MNVVDRNRYKRQTQNNASFSSTLLDVIYRSIDEKNDHESVVFRKSPADFKNSPIRNESNMFNFNSNINSFNSRNRLRFQSSEPVAVYEFPSRAKPIPIRTGNHEANEDLQPNSNLMNTKKSRAMMKKIYSYLNKGKQPISPGGRFTTFLISLFSTTDTKKAKISSPCNGGHDDAIIHTNTKSKSKLAPKSSTSSSSVKLTSGMKRSVRYYPASMFIDESIHRSSVSINRNCKIEETGCDLLRNYQKKVEIVFNSIENNVTNDDDDDGDDDESASCASSDLFELDHLSAMQELPLYETTSIDVNRAIANGLIL